MFHFWNFHFWSFYCHEDTWKSWALSSTVHSWGRHLVQPVHTRHQHIRPGEFVPHWCIKKSIGWFHKVDVEILLGTAIELNALILYNEVARKKAADNWPEKISSSLLNSGQCNVTISSCQQQQARHCPLSERHCQPFDIDSERIITHCWTMLHQKHLFQKWISLCITLD